MFASTALLVLSMEMEEKSKLLKARERMTLEDLENEFQRRKNRMNEISRIFASMRGMLTMNENKETALGNTYADLKQSLTEFDAALIAETATTDKENNTPVETAEKLRNTVRETLDKSNSLEDKIKSITEFRDYARNAKHSVATKTALGATIGGLATAAFVVPMLVVFGVAGLFAGPVGVGICVTLAMAAIVAYGAVSGAQVAKMYCKDQDDARGHDVSKKLQTLVTERSRFFQTSINAPPEYSADTKDHVMESTLRYSGSG